MEFYKGKPTMDMNQNLSLPFSGRKVAVYAKEQGTVCLKTYTPLEGYKFTWYPNVLYIHNNNITYKLYIVLLLKTYYKETIWYGIYGLYISNYLVKCR